MRLPSTNIRLWRWTHGNLAVGARTSFRRGLGPRWFAKCRHGDALITHLEDLQLLRTARRAKDYLGHDPAQRWRLDRSPGRCVLGQAEMRACLIVIGEVRGERAAQVTFVPDDHVVETLPANGSDQALRVGILPRRARRRAPIDDAETRRAMRSS